MIILTDTHNERKISTHHTIEAAVKAQKKHLDGVKKANGSSSYLTYSITSSDGRDIGEDILLARMSIDGL
jgi:hypothetical protein